MQHYWNDTVEGITQYAALHRTSRSMQHCTGHHAVCSIAQDITQYAELLERHCTGITQSGLRQAHSIFYRQRDLVLPLSISVIFFFPLRHSVAAYVWFLVSVSNV
jgi:hypothetical protein